MSIRQNVLHYQQELPRGVQLIAVSKTKPVEDIREAYEAGQRIFGENKAQDMAQKHPQLPGDIQWHFIGHLQTNKVKVIAPFVDLIHAVDSLRLLKEIDKQAELNQRIINCLLQFHIAEEDTKFGLNMEEARVLLSSDDFTKMKHVHVKGVMGMATFTDNQEQVIREFQHLHAIFNQLKEQFFKTNSDFKEISMGMSDDYHQAIAAGSTMIRIGTGIFGARNYH